MNELFIMLHCRLTVTLSPVISGYAVPGLCLQCHITDSKFSILEPKLFWCCIFVMFQSQANPQAATEARSQIYYWWKMYKSRTLFFKLSSHLIRITPENFAQLTVRHPEEDSSKFNFVCKTHHGYMTFVLRFIKRHENIVLLRFSGGELRGNCFFKNLFSPRFKLGSKSLTVSLFSSWRTSGSSLRFEWWGSRRLTAICPHKTAGHCPTLQLTGRKETQCKLFLFCQSIQVFFLF